MNCAQIEKRLSLYVSDDLSADEASQVRAHLHQCLACRAEAEAFAASLAWLRVPTAAPVPAAATFNEDFYADLRASVNRELTHPASPAVKGNGWSLAWLWRPLPMAACVVLLLIAGGMLLSRLAQMKGVPPTDIVITPSRSPLPAPTLSPVLPKSLLAQAQKRTRHAPRSQSPIPLFPNLPPPHIALTKLVTATAPAPAFAASPALIETDSLVASEMLRIEMQTADPNIRIIWLTPKENQAEMNKPTTGMK